MLPYTGSPENATACLFHPFRVWATKGKQKAVSEGVIFLPYIISFWHFLPSCALDGLGVKWL